MCLCAHDFAFKRIKCVFKRWCNISTRSAFDNNVYVWDADWRSYAVISTIKWVLSYFLLTRASGNVKKNNSDVREIFVLVCVRLLRDLKIAWKAFCVNSTHLLPALKFLRKITSGWKKFLSSSIAIAFEIFIRCSNRIQLWNIYRQNNP